VRTLASLQEYGSTTVVLEGDQARALSAAAGPALSVSLSDPEGRHVLQAAGIVGTVVVDDCSVLIRPKVPFKNLFYLLGV
jgi:hypothetical protein